MSLLWSAVTRDNIVLAECGEDHRGGAVLSLARKILSKKPSPGWEYERAGALKAAKFHIHSLGPGRRETVWAVCCVYENTFSELQARGFLEKLAFLTEPLRATPAWQTGGTLAAQDSFAPTLLQRMEQASSMGRTAMITSKVDEVKELMRENIELLLDRGDKLDALDEKVSKQNTQVQYMRSPFCLRALGFLCVCVPHHFSNVFLCCWRRAGVYFKQNVSSFPPQGKRREAVSDVAAGQIRRCSRDCCYSWSGARCRAASCGCVVSANVTGFKPLRPTRRSPSSHRAW